MNFLVKKGAVFGYLGPNGAGKSTTIRSLMGFIKPNSGASKILDLNKKTENIEEIISYDSWTDSDKIQKIIGYVPGEIAFPENMTGIELLKMVFKLRNMSDWNDVKKQIYYWKFDPSLKIKKMSKGMKQKLALCIAWMHNPDIIILDEPTTGLDPLMQEKFVNLVKKSKKEGKTIILSSHIFSEIEKHVIMFQL
ncbi:ABC transporter ATP-binding protein [Spiroplasma taiwanense]|uniref:ABC transporter ATP-binding protein n=1 Tax=Spiroplasma taiwanense TaxID=2145 RepID=UPI0022A92D75|nr:ATP-binding cassette domain-containing protein [Spiroplasma taiwanense]